MKTYANHLKSTGSVGEDMPINYRPVMRSSAVFPIVIRDNFDTEITFLGYWFIKRNINEITVVLTFRSENGDVLKVKSLLLDSVQSYVFSMTNELGSEIGQDGTFVGSIEIEIFSARDMVFPYPAITVAFKAELGTTFVHACGRIYNDMSDYSDVAEIKVPEAGFDIIPTDGFNTFISFVNGPIRLSDQKLNLQFQNFEGDTFEKELLIGELLPYATRHEFIFDDQSEKTFFKSKKGTVKIDHSLEGFFPRFIVGNMFDNYRAMSLTHTFYDTSGQSDVSSYWDNPNTEDFYDSQIAFPIIPSSNYTELVVYPIHSPHVWKLSFWFFTANGELIGFEEDVLTVGDGQPAVSYIDANSLLEKQLVGKPVSVSGGEELVVCKVIVDGGGKTPARLKFGLNIGQKGEVDLPSNICFNATVPNINMTSKPGTFKWCPIFVGEKTSVPMMNTSFLINGNKNANCEVSLWRASDSTSMKYDVEIPDNGCVNIMGGRLEDVEEFLEGQTGWATIKTDNPFVSGFYVTNRCKGVIGADHVY